MKSLRRFLILQKCAAPSCLDVSERENLFDLLGEGFENPSVIMGHDWQTSAWYFVQHH